MRKLILTILISCFATQSHANILDGLVGWWKFDELSGNATDSSGKANTGTPTGTTIQSSIVCARSGCRLFNGTSDSITISPAASINNLTPMTIAYWSNTDLANNGLLIEKNTTAFPSGWRVNSIGGGQIQFRVKHSTTSLNVRSTASSTANAWVHTVITWDGTTTGANVIFYFNGASAGTTVTTDGVGTQVDDSADSLYIGGDTTTSLWVNGKMDDVRLYNRVLTAQEIKDLYSQVITLPNATIANGILNQ